MKTLQTLYLLIIKFLITFPIFITNTGQIIVTKKKEHVITDAESAKYIALTIPRLQYESNIE